tara:strand:- start:3324 stop:3722 length:399 start_codon:yes stop_codon:yes gene_type:complete
MENTISFDLVSPENLIFSDNVNMIIVPGKEGDIGVLPKHSSLLSSLRPGRLMIYNNKQLIKNFFVSGGFVEINPEKCIVLAEEVSEMSSLDKATIETLIKKLENEKNSESKQEYLIAKSKIQALELKYYEKI